ncbi:hypothetical protein WA026_012848 [Henosepilachna vigintioctopunctata]|uniref:Uncharacterized protein n=1 Tax=Henosepilachna vigintioctopunctata TaxID=420089 RepID=A0AAW1TLC1_9CUCU
MRSWITLGYQLDYRELARQNKITEQILQNYLEKRLFPHKHRPSQAPSIWDILPSRRRKSNNNIQDQLEVIRRENETLESDESNQVGAVYENNDDSIYEEEDCPNCVEDSLPTPTRWTMPLLKLGEKRYYLGIFFKIVREFSLPLGLNT